MRSRAGPAALVLVAALAGCARTPAEPVTHVAVVTDRSNSIVRGDGSACRAVRRLVQLAVRREGPFAGTHVTGGLSRIRIFGTPDARTPGVPRTLLDAFRVPSMPAGFEAVEHKRRRHEQEVQAALERVHAACLRYATQENASPVYAAVKAAADWLHTEISADPAAEGLLVIQSDLVETHERPVAAAVRAIARGERPPAPEALRPAYGIDLRGRIGVFVCGVGLGTDVQQEAARARIVALWREAILLHPRTWRVESTCPGYDGRGVGGDR